MVLSSWQSHCESSPGSFDECRLSAQMAANPQTKPADSDWEYARKKWQQPSTSTIAILLLLSPRADTHFTVPRRVEGWVHLCTAVQPVPKAVYRSGSRDKHNCPWWDSNLGPRSHTAVRHVTITVRGTSPLPHCITAPILSETQTVVITLC